MPHGGAAAARAASGATASAATEPASDPELQALVAHAAEAIGAPIAVVCLASARGPRLHAIHGVAHREGDEGRAGDDDGFCDACGRVELASNVEGPFEARDPHHDARVPRGLVARHHVRACLGAPVRVGGEARGVLCVMDTGERSVTDADRAALGALADRASRRVAQLAVASATGFRNLLERATGPAFGEIRNLLNPMRLNLAMVRATVSDLAPLVDALEARVAAGPDLAARADDATAATPARRLASASDTLGRLHASFESFEAEVKHLQAVVLAVEAVVTNEHSTALDDAVGVASQLSHHMTKLVGGLRWSARPPVAQLALARSVAIAAIAATISSMASWLLARRASPGLRGWFGEPVAGAPLRLYLAPTTDAPGCADECARDLAALLANEPLVRTHAEGGTLCLELPRP